MPTPPAIPRVHWSHRFPPELAGLLILSSAIFLVCPLNTDSAYCLVAGRRLLEGDRLYVDLMETNPPLIFWFMAGLAWVGRHVSLGDARLVGAFVGALFLLSSMAGVLVTGLSPRASRPLRFCIFAAFACSLILPFISWTGQREQIAAILALPYTLLAARAASGLASPRRLSICCGLLGGLGFAIKPFFLTAWIAIELVVALLRGRWPWAGRPDFWVVASLQAVYVAAILIVTPEYVTDAVPLASALYGAYGRGVATIVRQKHVWLLAAIGLSACVTDLFPGAGARPRYAAAFGAATIGWLAAYVIPGKGWYYHLLPTIAFGTVAWLLAMVNLIVRGGFLAGGWRRRAFASALMIPLLVAFVRFVPGAIRLPRTAIAQIARGQPRAEVQIAEIVEQAATGEPVYFFSTSMWPAFPVVNIAGVKWPYRYHFLWPIPSLYPGELRYRAPDEQSEVERRFFTTVIADLQRYPPRILVVDRRTDQQAMRGRTFDFIEYFSGSAEFRTLWTRYKRFGYVGQWELFERR